MHRFISSFETDREEKNSGEFTITVLPASTEQVLSLLRSMGEILSQSSSNTDISSKLSNAEKKLSDLMAEKNRLEKLLKEELSTEEQQRTNLLPQIWRICEKKQIMIRLKSSSRKK